MADADIVSTFDGENNGWAIVAYPFRAAVIGPPATSPLPFDAGFGNPAGSVRVGDVYAETGITAPTAYLGDKRAFYGGTLTYDIYLRYTDNVIYPAAVLVGAAMLLHDDAPSPVLEQWESRVVPLSEPGWKIGGSGVPVTHDDFMSVLQTLAGLYIYTEWHTGADDTNVDNVVLAASGTAVGDAAGALLAVGCSPNPFNPSTTLRFDLPVGGRVRLAVYDVAGRLLRTLLDVELPAGSHEAVWDGRDSAGRGMASGSYFARLLAGEGSDGASEPCAVISERGWPAGRRRACSTPMRSTSARRCGMGT